MTMPTVQAKEHNEKQDYVGGERDKDIIFAAFFRVGYATDTLCR